MQQYGDSRHLRNSVPGVIVQMEKEMKHSHWVFFLYEAGCPPCKVRQIRYGFRMDPLGRRQAMQPDVLLQEFTPTEMLWILRQFEATHEI